jgi:hemoglobin
MEQSEKTLYELMGGAEKIRELIEAFYPKVQAHPSIGHLFPEDITPVMEKQFQFLSQFLGGPNLYTEQYGHPMMRARHLPFPITHERADAWLDCMRKALREIEIDTDLQRMIWERLSKPAHHFVNC